MKNPKSIFCFFIGIIAFTIPLSSFLSVRLIVLLLIYCLLFERHKKFLLKVTITSWDIFLYFVFLLIGLSYSDNFSGGLGILETNFCLLSFSVIFNSIPPLKEKQLLRTSYYFVLGLFWPVSFV